MASLPGLSLEDFLEDFFMPPPTENELKRLTKFYEKYRERVEERLLDFNEEKHGSWRDYRSVNFEFLPDPPEDIWDKNR